MQKDPRNFKIAIVGAGTMGMSIAQHFATHGHKINLYDAFEAALEKAKTQIEGSLKAMKDLEALSGEQVTQTLSNVTYFSDLKSAVSDVDMVIESVPENVELKQDIFSQLSDICRPDAILSSNTSSLNIYDFIKVKNPGRVVITHFFVPAYVMPLVEVVCGPETSAETVSTVKELLLAADKKPAVLTKVVPGFIVNRITFSIFREAAYMLGQGWCTKEDIDAALVSTYGPRYAFEGPFALVDFAGVDTYTKIASYLLPELCRDTEVPQVLNALADQGKLGVKSKEGFYKYDDITKMRADREKRIIKNIQAIQEVNEKF